MNAARRMMSGMRHTDPTEVDPVVVVGIGDDGPDGLCERAREAIGQAALLVGGRRHLAWFSEHPAEQLTITNNITSMVDAVAAAMHRGRVVVLASGDPLFYGIGAVLASRIGQVRVEIVPHVGSIQLAFARAGVSWHDAALLSAHGRPLAAIIRPALDAAKAAILTDDVQTPAVIASALLEAGMEDCRALVCEHLGGPRERVIDTTLYNLAGQEFAPLNVLLLLRGHPTRPPLPLGLPDDAYAHLRGQITKAEIRAVSLSKLRLRRGDTVWDIGAGSGSVSIEAALLCGGRVYAVERSAEQWPELRANIAAFHAAGVQVVEGEAPEILAGLPPPDAVFVGGSGSRLRGVLDTVEARLRPGGRVVLNLTLLDHLADCRAWLAASGAWEQELIQLQVARAVSIAGDERLAALNPIWILGATKREQSRG